MNAPENLKYSKTHEWIKETEDGVVIGITDHAQSELGDIVYLELSETGRMLSADDIFGTVESVKAVSELYSPVSGEVIAANTTIADTTDVLNTDPYGEGWLIKVRMSKPEELNELLSATEYAQLIEE
jgi:glycine cleavage system H protein